MHVELSTASPTAKQRNLSDSGYTCGQIFSKPIST